MQITECQKVAPELAVAPCLACGHPEVLLAVSGLPTRDGLAAVWNRANDLQTLLDDQQVLIDHATARIQELQALAQTRGTPVIVGPRVRYTPAPQQAGDGRDDPLYAEAVALIRERGRPSISLLQRHFRIGYHRASRLLEAMVGTVLSEYSPHAKFLPA